MNELVVKHAIASEEGAPVSADVARDFAQSVAHTYTKVYDDIMQLRPAAVAAAATARPHHVVPENASDSGDGVNPRHAKQPQPQQQQQQQATQEPRRRRSVSALPSRPRRWANPRVRDKSGRTTPLSSRSPRRADHTSRNQYDANVPVHERLFATRKLGVGKSHTSLRNEGASSTLSNTSSTASSTSISPTNSSGVSNAAQAVPQSRSRVRHSSSVADDLWRWQQRNEAKVERQRELLQRQVLRELKPGPEINKRSASLALRSGRRKGALADRAAAYKQASIQKQEVLRQALQVKENETLRDTPTINKQSHQLVKHRSVQDRMSWQVDRDAKVARQRQLAHELQTAQLDFSPRISGGSRRIAQRLSRPGHVGDRLHRTHRENQERREERLREQTLKQQQQMQPSPSPSANNNRHQASPRNNNNQLRTTPVRVVAQGSEEPQSHSQQHRGAPVRTIESHHVQVSVSDRLYGIALQRMRDRDGSDPGKFPTKTPGKFPTKTTPVRTRGQPTGGSSKARRTSTRTQQRLRSRVLSSPSSQSAGSSMQPSNQQPAQLINRQNNQTNQHKVQGSEPSRQPPNSNRAMRRHVMSRQPSPTPLRSNRASLIPDSPPPPPPPPPITSNPRSSPASKHTRVLKQSPRRHQTYDARGEHTQGNLRRSGSQQNPGRSSADRRALRGGIASNVELAIEPETTSALVGTFDSAAARVYTGVNEVKAAGVLCGSNAEDGHDDEDEAFLLAAGKGFVHTSQVVAKYAGLNLQH